jgi:nitroimidazol reductase NimA-like FMN-containing flavoprotein (pyridoxamine 5'-phosphate oxidase superfamily)
MELDHHGLEVIPREECLDLLRASQVGRVVVTDRALPAAYPVNFALLDDDVVFLSTTGSKLSAAEGEAVVAFEVDDLDPVRRTGWSVLVQGLACLIEDPDELVRAWSLPLEPWAPVGQFHFVRIRSELVSGRRLVPSMAARGARQVAPSPIAACGACGSRDLLPVTDGFTRNFLCSACAACWHLTRGELRRVRPDRCAGCSFKAMCAAAAVRDDVLAREPASRA